MKRKMSFLITILVIVGSLSSCSQDVLPSGTEIEEFAIMEICGVDKSSEDPSLLEVTFLTETANTPSGENTAHGPSKEFVISSATGTTVFEAERKLKARGEKKQFFGYVDFFLIGEEAAKEDLGKYFDFITRDHEIRYSPQVFIVKNGSAKDMMNETTSKDLFLMSRLDNVEDDISLLSNFGTVNIVDVASMLNEKDTATVIPAIMGVNTSEEKLVGGTPPEKLSFMSGYAVIRDFRLVGYFDETYSRGYNFLVSKVHSSPVSVQDFSGNNVGLEILYEKTKVEATFNGDTLERVTYKVHIYSNIVEQQSRENIYTSDSIDDLCNKQSDIIKGEMEKVISVSKVYGIDSIELGEHIRTRYPYKWENIKDNWGEIFVNLPIDVEVETDIRRTYDLHEPNGYSMGRE